MNSGLARARVPYIEIRGPQVAAIAIATEAPSIEYFQLRNFLASSNVAFATSHFSYYDTKAWSAGTATKLPSFKLIESGTHATGRLYFILLYVLLQWVIPTQTGTWTPRALVHTWVRLSLVSVAVLLRFLVSCFAPFQSQGCLLCGVSFFCHYGTRPFPCLFALVCLSSLSFAIVLCCNSLFQYVS